MVKNNKIVKNTSWLMIFYIAKMVFPFLTLPYLTRILSTDIYGTVAYVKTIMTYMQIIVDFGFVLSATKDIVKVRNNKNKVSEIIGDTLLARIIMGLIAFVVLLILIICIPILRNNIIYTLLSYLVVFMSIFLMDYLFKGLEIMHVITTRFVLMKIISTILTFIFVKDNSDMLLIPILDIISSLVAVLLVLYKVKKLELTLKFTGLKNSLKSIKESFVYFLSSVASTSFNALSTLVIGLMISPTEVAYWSLCIQITGTIQSCYSPFSEGVYPEMIKTKNISLMKKILKIFLPLVFIGCIIMYFIAGPALNLLGGQKYLVAVPILRILIPTLFFGFVAIMLGWPTLGAIGKTKETTISTVVSVLVNFILLVVLIIFDKFTLVNIAIVRVITEIILFSIRLYYTKKNIHLFNRS